MINNSKKKEYKTPTCEFFGMATRKVMCISYGDAGAAGADTEVENDPYAY